MTDDSATFEKIPRPELAPGMKLRGHGVTGDPDIEVVSINNNMSITLRDVGGEWSESLFHIQELIRDGRWSIAEE
jgi:hypothetical protein